MRFIKKLMRFIKNWLPVWLSKEDKAILATQKSVIYIRANSCDSEPMRVKKILRDPLAKPQVTSEPHELAGWYKPDADKKYNKNCLPAMTLEEFVNFTLHLPFPYWEQIEAFAEHVADKHRWWKWFSSKPGHFVFYLSHVSNDFRKEEQFEDFGYLTYTTACIDEEWYKNQKLPAELCRLAVRFESANHADGILIKELERQIRMSILDMLQLVLIVRKRLAKKASEKS